MSGRARLRDDAMSRAHVCRNGRAAGGAAPGAACSAPVNFGRAPHGIEIAVHPEVEVGVTVTVALNADEAVRINRVVDLTIGREEQDEAAAALAAAEEFFDPEARRNQAAAEAAEQPTETPAEKN